MANYESFTDHDTSYFTRWKIVNIVFSLWQRHNLWVKKYGVQDWSPIGTLRAKCRIIARGVRYIAVGLDETTQEISPWDK
jgi:hypothetical protein